MNIVIVHLKRSGLAVRPLFKVDRSTVLGNPASHLPHAKARVLTDTVDDAVIYFGSNIGKLSKSDPLIAAYLEHIYQAAVSNPTIYLGCWCMDELDPKPYDHGCHTTVIRNICYKRHKRETS